MQTKKYAIDVYGNDQDKEWEFADQIDFICYMRDLRGALGLTPKTTTIYFNHWYPQLYSNNTSLSTVWQKSKSLLTNQLASYNLKFI